MDAVHKQKEDVPYDSENPLFPFGMAFGIIQMNQLFQNEKNICFIDWRLCYFMRAKWKKRLIQEHKNTGRRNKYYFPPKTFFSKSVVRATGLALIFFSSSAILINNPCIARSVVYATRSGLTFFTNGICHTW